MTRAKKPKKAALAKHDPQEWAGRAMRAGKRMHELFAEGEGDTKSMVDALWAMFNDRETPPADKLKIAKMFAETVQQREQMTEMLGLSKAPSAPQHADKIVNIQMNGDMPFPERLKLIEANVNGVGPIAPPTVVKDDEEAA